MAEGTASLAATLRLALVAGVGPRTQRALLQHFGTAERVLSADPSELKQVKGVGHKLCIAIRTAYRTVDAEKELQFCRESGIDVLDDGHAEYPANLRTIHDPPAVLFRRGNWLAGDSLAIAVVGTRHASSYGLRQAAHLAGGLARVGFTVVSGLARGIDAAAHRAVLTAGGRTIAVLGSGLANVYPPQHVDLADHISRSGAVLAEMPPRSHPLSGAFPQRNRLVSGLTLGVLVVEAPERSGALITAAHAVEQGREVFAVPGPVDQRGSRGCHRLLRDGAKLVEHVDDVLEELGPLAGTIDQQGSSMRHPAELLLNEQERRVLEAIESQPTTVDQIVVTSGLPVQRVLATASVLEMRRLVRRISGTLLARV